MDPADQADHLPADAAEHLLTPAYHLTGKSPRYYQEIAINRAVQAILQGTPRILLTMATGTGKTVVAFQICWKLWSSRWNRDGRAIAARASSTSPTATSWSTTPRTRSSRPSATPAARSKTAIATKSREMYFAIYQAIAEDERRPGLYREYAPGLLRPDHRGRVPPRQRPRREQLARDPGILRAGLSSSA